MREHGQVRALESALALDRLAVRQAASDLRQSFRATLTRPSTLAGLYAAGAVVGAFGGDAVRRGALLRALLTLASPGTGLLSWLSPPNR
jgi:hypothetical protein